MTSRSALRFVIDRLWYLDEATREGLLTTAEQAGRGSPWDRLVEFVGVIGFALVSWTRWGTGDARLQTLRQGVRLGALLTSVLLVLVAAGAGALPLTVAVATLSVAIAAGLVPVALLLAAASLFLAVSVDGSASALAVLVVIGLAVGRPFDERRCAPGGVAAAVLLPAASWLTTMAPILVDVLGATVVVAFIVIGWREPRFAIAATVLSVATLILETPGRLLSAVQAALGQVAWETQMFGIAAMIVGTLAAAVVAHSSVNRAHGLT